jgi:two-component sensor histidine kinase
LYPLATPYNEHVPSDVTFISDRGIDSVMVETALAPQTAQHPRRWIERLPVARDRPYLGIIAMLAIVAAAWLLRTIADPLLPSGFPYVTFFPAVIITSFLFGAPIGSAAALLCGLLAWYFFIPPVHTFMLTQGAGFALGFYILVVATDLALVHWMQSANRQLATEREVNRTLADTRELLFRELQHRVSNNLQVAASLLSLQKRQLVDVDARAALDEAAGRLALIGRISRQIYDPSGSSQPMVPFLGELCRSVIDASGRSDVALDVKGDDQLRVQPDAAIPIALIVAEAVANAIEHGFSDSRSGLILVEVVQDPQSGPRVTIHDNGHGLPDGFEGQAPISLGMKIATTLARGQGGSFDLQRQHGTLATLTLPTGLLVTPSAS